MSASQGRRFLRGLTTGAAGTFVGGSALLYLLSRYEIIAFTAERIPSLGGWLDWAYMNLGSSIPVFVFSRGLFFAHIATVNSVFSVCRRVIQISGVKLWQIQV